MAGLGHEVVVANPRQVELIARNHRKTDRQGPRGRAPVVHGRGLSPQDGGPHPSRAPSGAVAAGGDDRRTDCPHRSSRPGHRGAVEAHPETAAPRQITGEGPITALTFVLTIEDPGRFPKNREVAAYLGLVPRQRDSGKREPQPGISRSGDPGLRPLRVQPAHYILGLCGPDTDLRRWGGRHAGTRARGHGSAPPSPSRGGCRCCCSRCGRAARSSSRCATPQPGMPRSAQRPPHATTETGGSDDPEQQRSDGRFWDRRLRGLARGVFAAEV